VDTSEVSHVLVGFSSALLPELDRLLPPRSVLVLEEPDVARVRRAAARCASVAAVAGVVEVPTQDEQHPERVAELISRPRRLEAVIPGVDYGVVCAAMLAESWDVPGAGLAAARALRDKVQLRRVAGEAGIAQPEWELADTTGDIEGFRGRTGGACVLKPNDRQGSLGVMLLDPEDDTELAWQASIAVTEPRLRAERPVPRRYLVEERLMGPEVSVEALVADGTIVFLNVTAKRVQPGPHPVEIGHVVPADLPSATTELLRRCTVGLVRATGFRSGILHGEWILVDGSKPHLLECAARLPGDSIDCLIDLAYGGRLVDDYIGLLGGTGRVDRLPAVQGAAICFLTAAPGSVLCVSGLEAARASAGVVEAEVSVQPGDVVFPLASSSDRIGQVIAAGADGATAESCAAEAASLIHIATELAR
jgi:biotin carboxylase